MNRTALFIAWRHLFSKKKHSLVNIIAIISAIGVLTGAAALVIVLSVFNGMEDLVVNSFNSFNPDIKITLSEGKSFAVDSFPLQKIRQMKGVRSVEEVVSDLVLLEYDSKQQLIELKGVDNDYASISGFDTLLIDGSCRLQGDEGDGGVMGSIAAGMLQVNLSGAEYFKLYYPKRLRKNLGNPADAFKTLYLQPMGVFSSNTEYDEKYLICPLEFARDLMSYEGEATSVEVFVKEDKERDRVQAGIENLLGEKYLVKNRYQQEELLFKTMKSEKLIIFAILSFILLIAVFNIIGTLAMIIIEKRDDTVILCQLGADKSLIRRTFLFEGMIISFIGGVVGMLAGAFICWLQQTFHLITMGNGGGYLVSYYPVKMEGIDFLIVFATILIISLIASSIPLRAVTIKSQKENE